MNETPLRAAVFASGGGTNFQALLDHQRPTKRLGDRPAPERTVHSAGPLARAAEAGVPTCGRADQRTVHPTTSAVRPWSLLEAHAGRCRPLSPATSEARARGRGRRTLRRGRILNIHPALLPSFGGKGMYGMNVHRAVLEAGVPESGATVHFVDERLRRRPRSSPAARPESKPGTHPKSSPRACWRSSTSLYPEGRRSPVCGAGARGAPGTGCPWTCRHRLSPRRLEARTTGTRNQIGVAMKRALLSVSDKSGIVDSRPRAQRARLGALSTGGTARTLLAEAGLGGHERLRRDPAPRDDGRAGEDAAPRDPRRPSRSPEPRGRPGRAGGARLRPHRPRGRQPLSVPRDRGEGRASPSTRRWSRSTSAGRR